MTTETKVEKLYTLDEFMALPDDGKRYELVKGELHEMSQPGDRHGWIGTRLSRKIGNYAEEHHLGEVWVATGFVIDPTTPKPTVRAPDVAFVTADRVPALTEKAVPVIPDLAIEIVSPTDIWSEVEDKIAEYRQAGIPLVWVIPPRSRLVEIYRLGSAKPIILGVDDELDGETVLPGFKLAVSELFNLENTLRP